MKIKSKLGKIITNPWVKNTLCPITGAPQLQKSKSECDHYPQPFSALMDSFLESRNHLIERITVYYDKEKQRYIIASKEGNRKQSDSGYRKRKAQKTLEELEELAEIKCQKEADREWEARRRHYRKEEREMKKLKKDLLEESKIKATLREHYDGGFL